MTDNVDANLTAVLVDPEDQGFYTSRAKQWATLCPHMSPTDHRVFALLLDLCSAQVDVRLLYLAEIAAMIPAGKAIAIGETPHAVSVSTIARSINTLSDIGQITDRDGNPIRVSNKTKTDLVIAPWRSLRHECTASRNVYDALARARGIVHDKGPRWPTGLGTNTAPNLVPTPQPAPNLVPEAPDLVPPAPNLVPTLPEMDTLTSGNSQESMSPSSSSSRTPTHTPDAATASAEEPTLQAGVCADPEDEQPLIDVLVRNVVKRTSVSKQKNDDDAKKEIMLKARQCISANVTIEEIDTALASVIDTATTHPINKGIKVLDTLLKRAQGASDPFGGSTAAGAAVGATGGATPPSWIDADGEEWPQKRIHERECQGRSCHDVSGKRYVSISQPGLGAFSCPICKIAYKKNGSAIA